RQYDLIYFDAFAPGKQPEMWRETIFQRLSTLCGDDAILTTYCAKGAVRRMLQSAGFTVERLPGPPGKREILRATKMKLLS
ncbi:MAG TPA: MnmC family methyltransferase, partial [Proteiniphilum sp.]|nr:MnmC family methyltransferase [Proteiniphilum sp.]